jgi:hypothetical protein
LIDQPDSIRDLYARTLNYSEFLTLSDKKTTVHLFTPVIWDFEVYFKQSRTPSEKRRSPSGFLRSLKHLKNADVFNDLQTFKDAISVEDLLSVMSFWHITAQEDLNTTNIVYPVNAEGAIIPTVIDYDEALNRSDRIIQRVPQIYLLEQSREILTPDQIQKISGISEDRLLQVMRRAEQLPHNPHDHMKPFTDKEEKKVIVRLAKLKEAMKSPSTIRSLMHKLIAIDSRSRPNLAQYYEMCEKTLKCSALDPLLKTPHQISGAVEIGRVGTTWYYPLEYVFAANWNTFIAGSNHGDDLKGYQSAPLKEITG